MNQEKMNNMATTHPRLLVWFASKNPFFVFIKLVPILLFLGFPLLSNFNFQWQYFVHFGIGIFVWSIFEYAIHRWLYHIQFKHKRIQWFFEAFHQYHHNFLDKHHVLNAGFLLIYPLFVFYWGLYFTITNNIISTNFFCCGLLTYYFAYEIVHYLIHYKKFTKGYMYFIQQYHLHHHYKAGNKNYGNTSTLWDKILGTYDVRYKIFDISKTESKHFIMNK
jgi:4-hydroxysphinganine ceramide fatty acyl 2-hydroxylase